MSEQTTGYREASEKYKLFRNYMTNELGVTRADIEKWTKESVAVEVNKQLGQINLVEMTRNAVTSIVTRSFGQGYSSDVGAIRKEIAEQIIKKISVTTKD